MFAPQLDSGAMLAIDTLNLPLLPFGAALKKCVANPSKAQLLLKKPNRTANLPKRYLLTVKALAIDLTQLTAYNRPMKATMNIQLHWSVSTQMEKQS